MDRKVKYSAIAVSLLPSALLAGPKKNIGKDAPKRPNIVFIMSDDHSYQTIGCYGHKLIKTPNLDRIAESGLFFRNNFVTNSVSKPSRATILTGKFTHLNGQRGVEDGLEFDQLQNTYPKLLQEAGYQTAIVGKWHLGGIPLGFDYYSVHIGASQQGHYYNPDFLEVDGVHRNEGYATDLTVDKCLEWLKGKRDPAKPFYLSCHFKAPHRNWMAALKKLDMYEDKTFPLPENFYDNYDGRIAARMQLAEIGRDTHLASDFKLWDYQSYNDLPDLVEEYERMTPEQKAEFSRFYAMIQTDFENRNLKGDALKEWKYQRFMRDYSKVISSVDDNVGRLIDWLQGNGLWENTIVIYTSDQGFMMGEHGWYDKRWMYEETFRSPFLISYPAGLSENLPKEMAAMIQNIDYMPTFLDYAGIPVPDDVQGISLRPLLEGRTHETHDAIYYHYYEYPGFHAVKRHYGCRTDRYKIIRFYYDIDQWELFDLAKDPMEMNNLWNDPGYKDVQSMMLKKLAELQVKYKEPDPTDDEYALTVTSQQKCRY